MDWSTTPLWFLITSRDCDSTISLGSWIQCLGTFLEKNNSEPTYCLPECLIEWKWIAMKSRLFNFFLFPESFLSEVCILLEQRKYGSRHSQPLLCWSVYKGLLSSEIRPWFAEVRAVLVRMKGSNGSSVILWRAPAVEKILMVGIGAPSFAGGELRVWQC